MWYLANKTEKEKYQEKENPYQSHTSPYTILHWIFTRYSFFSLATALRQASWVGASIAIHWSQHTWSNMSSIVHAVCMLRVGPSRHGNGGVGCWEGQMMANRSRLYECCFLGKYKLKLTSTSTDESMILPPIQPERVSECLLLFPSLSLFFPSFSPFKPLFVLLSLSLSISLPFMQTSPPIPNPSAIKHTKERKNRRNQSLFSSV